MTDKGTQGEPPQSNDAQMTDGAPQKIKKARKAKLDRKDSQLIIRVKGSDRDAFVDLCEALDTSAAREIRRFMREFTLLHSGAAGSAAAPLESVLSRWACSWRRSPRCAATRIPTPG